MSRFALALIVASLFAGCRPSATPAPPPTAQTPAAETPNDANAAATASPTSPQPAPMSGGLRDWLGKYLESDGAGGWRPNEKAATEVEKLAPSAQELSAALSDSQPEVRRGAAFNLLSKFDPADREQVAALTAALGDDDPAVRSIARSAVSDMREADQVAAAPQLANLLQPAQEARAENRAAIARLLGTFKGEAAPVLPKLQSAAQSDPDARVRSASLVAIGQIATPDSAAGDLAKGLADKDAAVRTVAAAQLRRLSIAAAPAARQLATALGDSEQRVRENAAEALILIGQPAVEPLVAVLGESNVEGRKYALAALAKIGPAAKAASPAVEKCLKDSDATVQKLAAEALQQIGP
jgi:HEAT repeat protein